MWVFLTACLGVLPLAGYMGEATEHLAHRTGPTVGGLLNATFGNAAELIIAIVALRAGLVDLVKASITGSILGNLLLIMGLAIIAGGARTVRAQIQPHQRGDEREHARARGRGARLSGALPRRAPGGGGTGCRAPDVGGRGADPDPDLRLLAAVHAPNPPGAASAARPIRSTVPSGATRKAMLVLAAATVGVAVESELLVHAATAATETLGLSPMFLGLIIIPDHRERGRARRGRGARRARDRSISALQIALGSSTQVALLVAPMLVFAGVLMGRSMNLVFTPFEVLALGMATGVAAIITLDGESHWFEGVQLLAVYAAGRGRGVLPLIDLWRPAS